MKNSVIEKSLKAWLQEQKAELAAPSICIQAFKSGRKKIDLQYGNVFKFYDLASLTKIIFSVSSTMLAADQDLLKLSDPAHKWIPELDKNIRIQNLLSHCAGLTWWKPYYKEIDSHALVSERWRQLISMVISDTKDRQKGKNQKAVYSDLDFFLLGEILNRAFEKEVIERWGDVSDRLGLTETSFHPLLPGVKSGGVSYSKLRKKQTAPTEFDSWRGRLLQGEVHDENTAALGGVSSHAGLFGPIEDVAKYGLELRKLALGMRSKLPKCGQAFLKRVTKAELGDWASGFMLPTKGSASCGKYFSSRSVGHTGFTGTSLWLDPKNDLLVVVLSNRVHPTRDNNSFRELRPKIHDFIFESI